jgi:hypothetical protein
MFTMKSEVVGQTYVVTILSTLLSKQFVKEGVSQFRNFIVNFHKFHALLSKRLSVRLGYHKLCAEWVPKILMGDTKHKEWLRLWL